MNLVAALDLLVFNMYIITIKDKDYVYNNRADAVSKVSGMIKSTYSYYNEHESHCLGEKFIASVDNRSPKVFDCALCNEWVQIKKVEDYEYN